MKTRKVHPLLVGLVSVVVLAATSSKAGATLVDVGEPEDVGSWSQAFTESGVGQFNFLAVHWLTPTPDPDPATGYGFEAPGFTNFSKSGWKSQLQAPESGESYPREAVAWGTTQTSLNFSLRFLGTKGSNGSRPFAFVFAAYYYDQANETSTLREQVRTEWKNNKWVFTSLETGPLDTQPVPTPEPGSLALFGLGLAVAGVRRRRAKRA